MKSPTKSSKNTKTSKKTAKRTRVYSMRMETRRLRVTLLSLSWECACQVTQKFHCSAHVREQLRKCCDYWFGVTWRNVSEWICKHGIHALWGSAIHICIHMCLLGPPHPQPILPDLSPITLQTDCTGYYSPKHAPCLSSFVTEFMLQSISVFFLFCLPPPHTPIFPCLSDSAVQLYLLHESLLDGLDNGISLVLGPLWHFF